MIKVHVLGCWGAYPAPGEATAGYLLETPRYKVLIDCGSGVLAQLFRICPIEELSAVIITHHHHDHIADLGVFGYAVLLSRLTGQRTQQLPLYLPHSDSELMQELRREPLLQVETIDEHSQIDLAGMKITFAPTVHALYCLAIRFEIEGQVFVFSADSAYCEPLIRQAQNADLFICEASLFAEQTDIAQQAGHLTSEQCGL
ncbi:MAG: Metal-dependent hydrolase of the beta-lactamase superfamily, partial [Bacilli bacterium]|nr:Metal-dependent hydrolase of the beta-lactamase superfamily [Bacilli bacterium]